MQEWKKIVVSEEKTEIWGVPNLYKGRCAPETPLAKKLRGPNFTLAVLHPETPLAKKLSFPKSALDPSKCM